MPRWATRKGKLLCRVFGLVAIFAISAGVSLNLHQLVFAQRSSVESEIVHTSDRIDDLTRRVVYLESLKIAEHEAAEETAELYNRTLLLGIAAGVVALLLDRFVIGKKTSITPTKP